MHTNSVLVDTTSLTFPELILYTSWVYHHGYTTASVRLCFVQGTTMYAPTTFEYSHIYDKAVSTLNI